MWLRTRTKSYSICNSDLLGIPAKSVNEAYCPKCRDIFQLNKPNNVHKDASNEDVYNWEYTHSCGARLLIIND